MFYDAEYLQWVEVSHPEAVSSYNSSLGPAIPSLLDSFNDVPPLILH